jgi:hypothetical protein
MHKGTEKKIIPLWGIDLFLIISIWNYGVGILYIRHQNYYDPMVMRENVKDGDCAFPDSAWQKSWMARHSDDVFNLSWSSLQAEAYSQIKIPKQ